MELSDSINFLSFLVIILIAVIVSPNVKEIVRKVIDFCIKSFGWLLFWGFIVLFIILICFLVVWAWAGLHQIFPRLWSFKEILTALLFYLGVGLCFYFYNKNSSRRTKLWVNVIGASFICLGLLVCISFLFYSTISTRDYLSYAIQFVTATLSLYLIWRVTQYISIKIKEIKKS